MQNSKALQVLSCFNFAGVCPYYLYRQQVCHLRSMIVSVNVPPSPSLMMVAGYTMVALQHSQGQATDGRQKTVTVLSCPQHAPAPRPSYNLVHNITDLPKENCCSVLFISKKHCKNIQVFQKNNCCSDSSLHVFYNSE